MKTRLTLLTLLLAAALLSSCQKEKTIVKELQLSELSITPYGTVADITLTATYPGKLTATLSVSQSESMANAMTFKAEKTITSEAPFDFSVRATGLQKSTTYYCQIEVGNEFFSKKTEVKSLTTLASDVIVTTSEISHIGTNSATCGCSIQVAFDTTTIIARGVCWSPEEGPTLSSSHTIDSCGIGEFQTLINGLRPNTQYYVRAYANDGYSTFYGNQQQFRTTTTIPTVITNAITDISLTSAIGNGNVTSDGGSAVTERGICWSTSHNPTIDNDHANSGTGTGSFSVQMNNLIANEAYYVRAYATNALGTSYGIEVCFITIEGLPAVTTRQVTEITSSNALGSGSVIDQGSSNVTERGICWNTDHNPTIENSISFSGSGTGEFTARLIDLSPGTKYYVRAFAKNNQGVAYGTEVEFTTNAITPSVSTGDITNITQTSAYGRGEVTDDGGATVTERGLCWSNVNTNPTIYNDHVAGGSGIGSFTRGISSLSAGTTYYVRAYATNSAGTSYGEMVSFTTLPMPPTVSTNGVTDITFTSATCLAVITSDGGASITERGVCWSTSHYPTLNDNVASNGSGLGSFSVEISDLTAYSKYYVRAYATNSAGTSYGNEIAFTAQITQNITVNGISFEMIFVEGGSFNMGAQKTNPNNINYDSEAHEDESPVHQVTLSDYYIGKFEVTQELWYSIYGSWPSSSGPNWSNGYGDNYPIYYTSWQQCQTFITQLNQVTGKTFRLPTEAEWEYAARGGNNSNGYKYSGSDDVDEVAWHNGNTSTSQPVGTKAPNEIGIYDMSGNVYEWCQDWYGDYSNEMQVDPQGVSSGSRRVNRGGSYNNGTGGCRVSYRGCDDPNSSNSRVGFRLVLVQ